LLATKGGTVRTCPSPIKRPLVLTMQAVISENPEIHLAPGITIVTTSTMPKDHGSILRPATPKAYRQHRPGTASARPQTGLYPQ
jgi:hypothetical protein